MVTSERVAEAARLVGADAFIRKLPQQYGQDVRERGLTLSGAESFSGGVTIGASGTADVELFVPTLPASVPAAMIFYQGIVWDAGGQKYLASGFQTLNLNF